MSIGIITDSHSGISQKDAAEMGIMVLPMPFYCDGECFYEGISITRKEFFEKMDSGQKVSTSQPSPEEVMNIWREGLKKYDQILYMPLTSGLSGAYNTACILSGEEEFDGKVYVVDHGRIATPLKRTILDAVEMIHAGGSAEQVKEMVEDQRNQMSIYIGVPSLEYLKKGGRVTPAAAAVGSILHINPILKVDTGLIDSFKKTRGMKKARREMLAAIEYDMKNTFRTAYEKGQIHLLMASSADEVTTKEWLEEIQSHFPEMKVMGDDLSMGISCHTGPGTLGVGISIAPDYKKYME